MAKRLRHRSKRQFFPWNLGFSEKAGLQALDTDTVDAIDKLAQVVHMYLPDVRHIANRQQSIEPDFAQCLLPSFPLCSFGDSFIGFHETCR